MPENTKNFSSTATMKECERRFRGVQEKHPVENYKKEQRAGGGGAHLLPP